MIHRALIRRGTSLAFAALLLTGATPSFSQGSGGGLSGTVTDSSGAVVAGAEVMVRNVDTGAIRKLTTSSKGFYVTPNLSPGPYEVMVTAKGFATAISRDVAIQVGKDAVTNVALAVSTVEETVEVKGAGTVALTSSTLSNVVAGETIRELPINGRDWTMLAALEPGVHTIEAQTPVSSGGNARLNRGWGTQLTVGGNRPQQNNYRLDGISINDYSGGGPGSTLGSVLGVDAIQEFSVVTGNASAEYGKTSGGVINAISRSGTNSLRGSAYEFLRDSSLDQANYFDANGTAPPFTRHQFGGSLGGPIRKDQTFFFLDYEGLRQDLSSTQLIVVPSRAAREGRLTAGTVTVDPRVAPYLAFFPLPNGAERGDVGDYSFVSASKTNENFVTGRIDHKLSDRDSLRATFMRDASQNEGPDGTNTTYVVQTSRRAMASLEGTRVFGSAALNTARLGWSRSAGEAPISANAIDPRATDASLGFIPGLPAGPIQVTGIVTFNGGVGGIDTTSYRADSYQFYDDLFLSRGDHSLKFGVAFEHQQLTESAANGSQGRYTFGSLANFLTNRPATFNASLPGLNPVLKLSQSIAGIYAQDDYHVRPNLTLNLGLRYEIATVPKEKEGRLSNLANLTDALPRTGNSYFENPTLKNFSPRVGFSWDPFKDGKTAVRGGVGLYYTLPLLYQFNLLVVNTAPFSQSGALTTLAQGTFPTGAYPQLRATDLRYSYIESKPKTSWVAQWNVNVERQLPKNFVAHLGYVGQEGRNQPFRTNDANVVLPTGTVDGLPTWPAVRASGNRLNPNVGTINALAWVSSNSYKGLNVGLQRKSKTLQAGVSYTWSRSEDTSSSSIAGSNFNNSIVGPFLFDPELMRGPSDFDVTHNLVINTVWTVPQTAAKGFKGAVLNGWQIGGIFRIASGLPFSPVIGGDSLGLRNGNAFNFPDRLNTPECANPINKGNPLQYIKVECFVAPTPGTRLGNSGRNSLRGPGIQNLDFSLVKNTYVGANRRFNVQFRGEVFNVLDKTNFAVPDRTTAQIFNQALTRLAAAGRLNATSTTARQMQLAMKVIW